MSRPVGDIEGTNFTYSSINYLPIIYTTTQNVNNNKLTTKTYIKPSKRGTFTAAATKHGMGVQEFASKVLRNKEDYSPSLVKKANFARNASKWH